MAQKCLVDGTAYDIKHGLTLIDGTGYEVRGGGHVSTVRRQR